MMKALQFYKYATWLLLTLNLAMVAFFLLTRPGPRPGGGFINGKHSFRENAIDILDLNESQQTAFLEFATSHSQAINLIDEQERSLLKKYFQPLLDTTLSTDQAAILQEIIGLEKEKITTTYQHFEEVRNLMHEEQEAKFAQFLQQALEILLLENQKKPPPPQDF